MKRSRFSAQQIAFVLRQAEEDTPLRRCAARRGSAKRRFIADLLGGDPAEGQTKSK
jgi:hypothetical protein